MKLNQTICLSLLLGCLVSCQRDNVDDVKFEVTTEQMTVKAGEPLRFVFEGNPDYITFYPGTKDCSYENRNRTKINNLQDLKVSCHFTQNYTEPAQYEEKKILKAYVSTDFTGDNTVEAVNAAHWVELKDMKMPVLEKDAKDININLESEVNLDAYKEKDFFLAFKYEAEPNFYNEPGYPTTKYKNYAKPRIIIKTLSLHKIDTDGYDYLMSDAINEWGLSFIPEEPIPAAGSYKVNESSIYIQPDKSHKTKNVKVWLVSKRLNGSSIAPDLGMPIKGTNVRLSYYEYRYSKPGTYKATFVATNAKMWDASQAVRELTIQVTE
ncbi:hypothetical protein, secreted [gut metagenome]|uniref:DUF5017 domain-containing protein n=1 Tax=gut metagenome TaxID=749906 RepID=J9H200_9ZZZZ